MAFELVAKLHKIFDQEAVSDRFSKREFVVATEGMYPQFVKFQLTQDRCDLISKFAEGQEVKVYFDLKGREWQGKYFTNLNAWKIEAAQSEAPIAQGAEPVMDSSAIGDFPKATDAPAANEELDDLPF